METKKIGGKNNIHKTFRAWKEVFRMDGIMGEILPVYGISHQSCCFFGKWLKIAAKC